MILVIIYELIFLHRLSHFPNIGIDVWNIIKQGYRDLSFYVELKLHGNENAEHHFLVYSLYW